MTCKVFISTSNPGQWEELFKERLMEECNLQDEEVYLFIQQRAGNEISAEIEAALSEALILLCIISDEYLQSPWCLKEHWLFTQKSKAEFVIGVMSPGLENWFNDQNVQGKAEYKDSLLKKIRPKVEDQFPRELKELMAYADKNWFSPLVDIRYKDFRKIPYLDKPSIPANRRGYEPLTQLTTQLILDLKRAETIRSAGVDGSERVAIRRLVNLSLFSLAADRYREGGWGFSLSHLSPEGSSAEFVRGRFEVNLLVLKALSLTLDESSLPAELEGALESGITELPRLRNAKDRLPQVAKFVASLQSGAKLRDFLFENIGDIAKELGAKPPHRRFDWEEPLNTMPARHHLLILSLVYLSREFSLKDNRFQRVLQAKNVVAKDLNTEQLEDLVKKWLASNPLFPTNSPSLSQDKRPRAQELLTAAQWVLMVNSHTGVKLVLQVVMWWQVLVGDHLQRFQEDSDMLIADALAHPSVGAEGFVLCLSRAYVLQRLARDASASDDLKKRAAELTQKLRIALLHKDACALLVRLNAIGWSVLILLSKWLLPNEGLDTKILDDLYRNGRDLRETKANFVREKQRLDELTNGGIRRAVEKKVEEIIEGENGQALLPPNVEKKDLISLLSSDASFWDSRPDLAATVEPIQSSCLAGVLRVRATGKVELESGGYQHLFLRPFSTITQMNVFDLLGVRRELGQDDAILVETMGAVVVEECYVRNGDRFTLFPKGFSERTKQITQELSSKSWNDHLGFDDLLKVRAGPTGHRWIYRTAILHPEFRASAIDEEGPAISWRFVEIPESVATLFKEDPQRNQTTVQ